MLDLATAFGMSSYTLVWRAMAHIAMEKCYNKRTKADMWDVGLGTASGYLWWYGT